MTEINQIQQASSGINEAELSQGLSVLRKLADDPQVFARLDNEQRVELLKICGQISRPSKEDFIKRNKAIRREKKQIIKINERKMRAKTGIRDARNAAIFSSPQPIDMQTRQQLSQAILSSPRNCYVCKGEYRQVHHFYDTMCPGCGDFNYNKRFQTANLEGQVALITGARLKIGYQAGLMLLRAGAIVIVTTRFPVDAALRYSREKDYPDWKDRLHIHGLDLRHTPSVEIFGGYIEKNFPRLDILINNAAQTVRRPPGFYAHLMQAEELPPDQLSGETQFLLRSHYQCLREIQGSADKLFNEKALPVAWHGRQPAIGLRASAMLSQIPYSYDDNKTVEKYFPQGQLDADLQQIDLRKNNSWRLKLGEIPVSEMLELQLINSVAPFVLCNRLVGMMRRDYTGKKHIVNVSAMEGKFHRFTKADRHPHTNMAKAALNMLTHTSASDLALDGIFMNAVDTGWVTDEDPIELAKLKQQVHDFQPPLDIVDGAARVCDPIFDGINTGKHWCGKFLKDYFPIDW